MNYDEQLKARPVCDKCKTHPMALSFMGKFICLYCFDRLNKKLKESRDKWLEEN